jgi:hypothetical protein
VGKMVAQIAKLWVESDEGTIQCIKWLAFGFLVFMISVSVAWAVSKGISLHKQGQQALCKSTGCFS